MADPRWHQDTPLRATVQAAYETGKSAAALRQILADAGYTVHPASLRRYAAEAGWKRPEKPPEPPEPSPAERVEARVEAERERLKLRADQRLLAEMAKAEARRRTWLQALRDAAVSLPAPEPWQPEAAEPRTSTPHAIIVQWHDLHAGKWVDPSVVGEQFTYDRFQLEASVERWLSGIRSITAIHRAAYPVDTAYVFILGDMVEGSDMRPIQKLRIDHLIGTVGRQTIFTGRVIAEVVRRLAAEFKRVIVVAVGGNHGRVGRFGENEVVDNFDWIAYHFAAESCRDIPTVRFVIPDTPTALLRIAEKTFFLQHGDAIRSWGESPANAVKRGTRKDAFAQRVFFDYALMGHFHQSIAFQAGGVMRVYMGGNWDGGDGYCVHQLKEACDPCQNVFVFHPRRGIVAHYEVALRETQPGPAVPLALDFDLLDPAA